MNKTIMKKRNAPEMKICGVISEIDIRNVIRLRLTIVVGFIDAIAGSDFLFIRDSNVA